MLILAAIYFAGLIAWWAYRKSLARRRQDAESGFLRRIHQEPGGAAAYEGLADSYRAAGRLTEALAVYQKALETGRGRSEALHEKMRRTQMDIAAATHAREKQSQGRRLGKARDLLTCIHCGAANALDERRCVECGQELLHDSFLSALEALWTDMAQRKRMLESAAVVAIPVLCVAFASNLSLEVKGVLIISTVIVGGWLFLNAFSGDRR